MHSDKYISRGEEWPVNSDCEGDEMRSDDPFTERSVGWVVCDLSVDPGYQKDNWSFVVEDADHLDISRCSKIWTVDECCLRPSTTSSSVSPRVALCGCSGESLLSRS